MLCLVIGFKLVLFLDSAYKKVVKLKKQNHIIPIIRDKDFMVVKARRHLSQAVDTACHTLVKAMPVSTL